MKPLSQDLYILAYWTFGSSFAYILGGMALILPLGILIRTQRKISQTSVDKIK